MWWRSFLELAVFLPHFPTGVQTAQALHGTTIPRRCCVVASSRMSVVMGFALPVLKEWRSGIQNKHLCEQSQEKSNTTLDNCADWRRALATGLERCCIAWLNHLDVPQITEVTDPSAVPDTVSRALPTRRTDTNAHLFLLTFCYYHWVYSNITFFDLQFSNITVVNYVKVPNKRTHCSSSSGVSMSKLAVMLSILASPTDPTLHSSNWNEWFTHKSLRVRKMVDWLRCTSRDCDDTSRDLFILWCYGDSNSSTG